MLTHEVQLRPDSLADWCQVAALLKNAKLPADDIDIQDTIEAFHVALDKGRVIGCAAAERGGASIVIRSVVVDPMYRDHGIASRLIGTLLVRARASGVRQAYLLSARAPLYFARWGFYLFPVENAPAEVRASAAFRDAGQASPLCMRCDLR
ncbi:hypothetical protein R1479_03193 [Ralstonia mannitolilytica]|uniref:GNAT family N-acetyltransferase n=1 Tax=Ralstonia mannitolilytica TaxID=105219 RepID=UPI0028F601DE|nr:GNAT family N-acetyltransferase [Ralstonia mannitolilytica]CAJ0886623.1 hypothetical protein R1479_03193 [Ralstonia mannitolilytica]